MKSIIYSLQWRKSITTSGCKTKHAKGFFVVKLSYISNDVDTMNYCQIMAEKLMNYCQIMAENLIAC